MSDAGSDDVSELQLFAEGPLADLHPAILGRLLERGPRDASDVSTTVMEVIADVRDRGDAALLEMAQRFDGVELTGIEVPRDHWDAALEALPSQVRQALLRGEQRKIGPVAYEVFDSPAQDALCQGCVPSAPSDAFSNASSSVSL